MASVSWKSSVGGPWSDAQDWSTGTVPGAADQVTIAAPGSYTIGIQTASAAKLTLNAPGATLVDSGTLFVHASPC